MSIKRKLSVRKLKEEWVEEYKRAHENIWPELVEEYKQAGIREVSCFLWGLDLYVYTEYDEETLAQTKSRPMPVDEKWQAYMSGMIDTSGASAEPLEVFRMR